jgi:hypothetical protein
MPSIPRTFSRRGPAGIAVLAIVIVMVGTMAGGGGLRATGNLEVITQGGTAIGNRVWHNNLLPLPWFYHDPTTIPATCNYVSTNAPAATLQPAQLAGFNTWQNQSDSRISFTYGGTTAVRSVGADGVNVITFCDASVLASNLGFLASTPSTALTVDVTVVADPNCPAGKGKVAGLFCFPVGSYPAGTTIDADIRYNTFGTSEQSFSTNNTTAGSFDVQAIATHEEGHFFGLSHDPILEAVMFPFIDDVPASDGLGQRVIKATDIRPAPTTTPRPASAPTTDPSPARSLWMA